MFSPQSCRFFFLFFPFFSRTTVGMYNTWDDCIPLNKKKYIKDYKAAASLLRVSWKLPRKPFPTFTNVLHVLRAFQWNAERWLRQRAESMAHYVHTEELGLTHSISIQMGWRRPRGSGASPRTIPWTRSLVLKLFPLLTISVKVEPTMHLASSDSGGGCQTKAAVALGMCMRLGCGGNGV